MKLLYLCEADTGGIVEYAVRQVAALSDLGVEVTVLCRPGFDHQRFHARAVLAELPERGSSAVPKWQRLIQQIQDGREIAKRASVLATKGNFDGMLIACYAEYFSPFWAGIFRELSNRLPIGTNAHDPVRDFVLGPIWWHRWSVRQGYSFVSHVFVHDTTEVDFGGEKPVGIKIHMIPHGPFQLAPERRGREAIREHYGFSAEDQVFLAFGQIRDGKNLDRFLRAMGKLPPDVKLLVAGSGGGGSQRTPEAYRKISRQIGVADRCVWDFRYIPDEETGDLFAVADFILMTYSAKFRSASGVLNAAVACRKPVLASSGEGPLKSSIFEYRLGVWVAPDDDEKMLDGARRLLREAISPEWERYERENSWETNAKGVREGFQF